MSVDIKDAARLNDMVNAATAIAAFIQGHTEQSYDRDLLVRSAVERQVEIIGEACRSLSDSFKKAHAEIPWKKIIASRHILAHDYGMIKNDIMWRIAATHIPQLQVQIQPLLPPPP